ncbi:hypothetical protein ACRAWC_19850 [Leifsonia sp. L25]|uniref:hypothetical protein n=1 Tax=Actinomycetes TaxID=1760 RepID=UPI003D680AFA
MIEAKDRDVVEGRYTQAEPETAEERVVHGQYTEGEGHLGPDTEVVGAYVGSEREGKSPLVRSTHQRSGNYPKAQHEEAEEAAAPDEEG